MPISESDPRVYFAAERTLLAWLRTGLTIMALGFVISRFGLFVQMILLQSEGHLSNSHTSLSAILGISFIVVGALTIFFAGLQHRRFVSTLPNNDLPAGYSKSFAIFLSWMIGLLGIALAVYLAFT